jgi:hypothetical protein
MGQNKELEIRGKAHYSRPQLVRFGDVHVLTKLINGANAPDNNGTGQGGGMNRTS